MDIASCIHAERAYAEWRHPSVPDAMAIVTRVVYSFTFKMSSLALLCFRVHAFKVQTEGLMLARFVLQLGLTWLSSGKTRCQ